MGEDRACKSAEPVMKAWAHYRLSEAARAGSAGPVTGAMWAAFSAGFTAGQAPQAVAPQPDKPRWLQPGDWMKFLGKNGYDFERERAREVFSFERWYEVERCEVGSFSHHIKFKRIDGEWNGVMFERCNEDGSPIIPVNTVPMSQILGQPKEEPKWVGFRPAKRPDGWPTRNAVEWWSDGEKAIAEAMRVVEHIPGGSRALTDAVTLLASARGRVADHVESCAANGKPAVPVDAIAATLESPPSLPNDHLTSWPKAVDWVDKLSIKPDKLVCNVVSLADKPDRVGCMSCGNTWATSLGVTGCVQGGHGGSAKPLRDGQLPEPEQPGGYVESDWKWLAGENARLRHEAVETMKAAQAELAVLKALHDASMASCEVLKGELAAARQYISELETDLAGCKDVCRGGAKSIGRLRERHHLDEQKIERAEVRAGRLWKALYRIVKADGCGCKPVCVCENQGHLLIWKDEVQALAREALREDVAGTASVDKIDPALEAELLKGLEPGPGRDECDGLPETTLMGPIAARAEHTVDGVERYAMCGHATYIHAPGQCPLSLGPETVGDAKEFGEAAAKDAFWKSCGCPVTKHPIDECNEPPKFVMAENKPEKLLNCPGCQRNDGEHDTDCIVSNPQGSRIRMVDKRCPGCGCSDPQGHAVDCPTGHQYAIKLRDPPPPRMVQIALLPGVGEMDPSIYAMDDRGRIWTMDVEGTWRGQWVTLDLPEGFKP